MIESLSFSSGHYHTSGIISIIKYHQKDLHTQWIKLGIFDLDLTYERLTLWSASSFSKLSKASSFDSEVAVTTTIKREAASSTSSKIFLPFIISTSSGSSSFNRCKINVMLMTPEYLIYIPFQG